MSIENLNSLYKTKIPPNKVSAIDFIRERINKNSLILDVGCGDGVLSNLISKEVKLVTAIDIDAYHVNQNKKKFSNIKNLNFINDDVFKFISINKKIRSYFMLSYN